MKKTKEKIEKPLVASVLEATVPIALNTVAAMEAAMKHVQDGIKLAATNVSKIVIKDDSSLKIAREISKDLNQYIKKVKDIVKDANAPDKERIDMRKQIGDRILGEAETILDEARLKIQAFETEKAKIEQAKIDAARKEQERIAAEAAKEFARVQKIRNDMTVYEANFGKALAGAYTIQVLKNLNEEYIKRFVPEPGFEQEGKEMIDRMIATGKSMVSIVQKKEALIKLNAEEAAAKQKEIDAKQAMWKAQQNQEEAERKELAAIKAAAHAEEIAEQAQEKQAMLEGQIKNIESSMGSGMRDAGWGFKVANDKGDMHSVSQMFLSIDEKKVKEFLKENKERIENIKPVAVFPGYSEKNVIVYGGLHFFKKDKSVVL